MHVNPLGCDAILPAVDEHTTQRNLDGHVHICIVQHDEWVFAAKLQQHRRQPSQI